MLFHHYYPVTSDNGIDSVIQPIWIIILSIIGGIVGLAILVAIFGSIFHSYKFNKLSDKEKTEYLDREHEFEDSLKRVKDEVKEAQEHLKKVTEASQAAEKVAMREWTDWRI
ncbi:hypothetical protein CLAFUW4_01640 [Fulvia fulva]|uniref:Uncharacterized protein n=1 Tax=Passalora fulva TaxID=5499 RepID=A0A9Q8L8D3_PASFU|nr:uncharacterized protein CLAFUR5_01639 [Fulvia fulva]KAK4634571.1 hypothetical protein CLAFUR4_01638 [Fulvia fulva]KAK4638395.1 hypothetical protein CLAFUR0_01639 [Fulvia fulva]UJO12801.1 hypothetical protein CLAFUR5_01639 [Fulvia fulva]WPV10332.1 hypothetical protein CLAFUW4_01640 [Fulvia fulva]WPV23889.1 hypothetical protein CLAFUW7_01642 [Fulvia fulva]